MHKVNFPASPIKMLDHVQSQDIGPVGDVLKELMDRLGEIDPDDLSEKKQSVLGKIIWKSFKVNSGNDDKISKIEYPN